MRQTRCINSSIFKREAEGASEIIGASTYEYTLQNILLHV